MTTRYLVDPKTGKFLGTWISAVLPDGTIIDPEGMPTDAIEVATLPSDGLHLWNGVAWVPPPPTLKDYEDAVQTLLDFTASAEPPVGRGYKNGELCASYANSTVPQWAAESQAFIAWRDQVWSYVYTQLQLVQSGGRAQPSVEQLLGELPAIAWP